MRVREAVVCALLISASPFAFGAERAPEPAISGIAEALPALGARERQKLTVRADAGDLDAMYQLAHHALRSGDRRMGGPMYYWGTWNDPRESERWWRKAAALGDPKAMILLGHLYGEPWGIPQDIREAAHWFEMAADHNNLEAVQALADLHMGAWSDERDDEKANQWLIRAASMGDKHAMLLLGLRYDAGWGIREDPVAAAQWYEKVIAGGWDSDHFNDLSTALNNLGALYEEGRGVAKDERKAAELYGKAARGGLTADTDDAIFYGFYSDGSYAAIYNLGALCETGRGVTADKAAAAWLYRKAAFREMPEAIAALKRLRFKIPTTAKEQNDEAAALLAHGKQKRARTACDP